MSSVKLEARLSLTSVVAFGLSYMAPSLAMVLFGIVAVSSAGTATTTFAVAAGALMFTALSYAKLSRIYPVSGSAYSYARQNLGAPFGFLVGWSILLDYLFLPMVAWLTQSILLNAQYPQIPIWAWVLINAGFTTMVNALGIVLADRVNRLLLAASVVLVLLFVVVCLYYLTKHAPSSYTAPVWNQSSSVSGVVAAAAIAAYSFLGYDAVTTLADETKSPHKTIPRAVVLTVLIGGIIFVAVTYVMALVHPGDDFSDPQSSAYTMSVQVGGTTFADWTNIAGILAGTGSCLAVQLSASRLLFIMGRDGVLPKRIFGALNGRTKTPVYCILITGCMSALGLHLNLSTATSFINFGAFLGFTAVNLCVPAYYIRHRHERALNPFGYVAMPMLGAVVTIYLLTQLSSTALVIGISWLSIGACYLIWLSRGFRRPIPEVSLDDAERPLTTGSVDA